MTIATRIVLAACAMVVVAVIATLALAAYGLTAALVLVVLVPVTAVVVRRPLAPMAAMFRALAGTVSSYKDGDFAFSLAWPRDDELGELVDAHNALGDTLRDQREALVHRELLLDRMVQNTPVAMLLVDPTGHVAYANVAARQLLGEGRRLEGTTLPALLAGAPEALREAIARGGDGLFEADEDIYYLARSAFRLNGRAHELFVLRRLTAELQREEVRTWKKVIRVISHELNNSLAPVASLAHSGRELVARGKHEQLALVFDTIAERARHLEQFIVGYAEFAKLPAPRKESLAWGDVIARLRTQIDFQVDGPLPAAPVRADAAQLEQALLNLVANAHESGSPASEVRLRVTRAGSATAIEVSDRGAGMSDAVLEQALLPFYSTKRGGTGLGLALVREIAEAHGGRVALANRDGGGLAVTITLPQS
jgi:nitrogen fixation/metabolism regulation signal transduction histidine kinase